MKGYGELFRNDPAWAERARGVRREGPRRHRGRSPASTPAAGAAAPDRHARRLSRRLPPGARAGRPAAAARRAGVDSRRHDRADRRRATSAAAAPASSTSCSRRWPPSSDAARPRTSPRRRPDVVATTNPGCMLQIGAAARAAGHDPARSSTSSNSLDASIRGLKDLRHSSHDHRPDDRSANVNYRILVGSVVPRPIAFVSTMSPDGVYNLAPFSFFNVVCGDPPVVCFCPIWRNPPKDTHRQHPRHRRIRRQHRERRDRRADERLLRRSFPSNVDEFEMSGLTPVASDVVRRAARAGVARSTWNAGCCRSSRSSARPMGGNLVHRRGRPLPRGRCGDRATSRSTRTSSARSAG